jgi:hypothetical protein
LQSSAISALSLPADVALIVWAFINLPWYAVIAGFIVVSWFVVPALVNQSTVGITYAAQPFVDAGLVLSTFVLWKFL